MGGLESFGGNGGRVQEKGRLLGCDEGLGCLEARFVPVDGRQNESCVRPDMLFYYEADGSHIAVSPKRRITMFISITSSRGCAFLDTKSQAEP